MLNAGWREVWLRNDGQMHSKTGLPLLQRNAVHLSIDYCNASFLHCDHPRLQGDDIRRELSTRSILVETGHTFVRTILDGVDISAVDGCKRWFQSYWDGSCWRRGRVDFRVADVDESWDVRSVGDCIRQRYKSFGLHLCHRHLFGRRIMFPHLSHHWLSSQEAS